MTGSLRCAGARSCHPKNCDVFKTNLIGDIEDLFVVESPLQSACLKRENEAKVHSSPPTRTGPTKVPARRLDHRGHRFLSGVKARKKRGTCPSETPGSSSHRKSPELQLEGSEEASIAKAAEIKDLEVVPVGPRIKVNPNSTPGSAEEKALVHSFWARVAKDALSTRKSTGHTQAQVVDHPTPSNVVVIQECAEDQSVIHHDNEETKTMALNDDQTEHRLSVQIHEFKGALETDDLGHWSADVQALPNQSCYHETEHPEESRICASQKDQLILADVGLEIKLPIDSGQHIGQPEHEYAQSTIILSPERDSMTTTREYYDEDPKAQGEEEENDDDWWDEDDDPDMILPPPPYYSLNDASNSTVSTRPSPTRAAVYRPAFNGKLTDLTTLSTEETLETPTRPPSPHTLPTICEADAEVEEMDDEENSPAVTDWAPAPSRYTKFPDDFLSDAHLEAYYNLPQSSISNGTPTRAQEVLVWRALCPARRSGRNRSRLSPGPSPLSQAQSASPTMSTWQRDRINQLQSIDKKTVAKGNDEDGAETDTEDVCIENEDKELDKLVEIIMGERVGSGGNKRRRLDIGS